MWKHKWEPAGAGIGMEGISACWDLMLALPGTQAAVTQFKLALSFHDCATVCVLLPLLVVLAWAQHSVGRVMAEGPSTVPKKH